MPRARWGISAKEIDNFDRDSQFTPYTGPIPPNGVYQFKLKVLKFVAATREKNAQLRIGFELVPRRGRQEERQFKGYFIMAFLTITDRNQFVYVPFCDAIGVSGSDFTDRTIIDENGDIKKIGRWRNDGKQMLLVQVKDGTDQSGNPRKDVGWIGALDSEPETDEDEEEYESEEEEIYEEEEEEERPARRAKRTTRSTPPRRSSPRTRQRRRNEEEDPF